MIVEMPIQKEYNDIVVRKTRFIAYVQKQCGIHQIIHFFRRRCNLSNIDLLTKVFEAFSNSSEGRYVYLNDLKTGISRWSKNCVDRFGLPGEVMQDAGQFKHFADLLHRNDLKFFLDFLCLLYY